MKIRYDNQLIEPIMWHLKKYNHNKYWKRRAEVINSNSKVPKLIRLWWLYKIKKSDAFNNASMGTGFLGGAVFAEPPVLPHLLNGIIVSYGAKIGRNVTIHQQVTIGETETGHPIIGDDVYIGAGAKILGGIIIGNNVRIGANAVVVKDVPNDCTVVGVPGIVLNREKS